MPIAKPAALPTDTARHAITRVRRDTRRRLLTVTGVERLTPGMTRVHFASPDLHDFASPSPDDHVKLFFPIPDGDTAMRDYTPRRFDARAGTLVLDFALHGAGSAIGPATAWALRARAGDRLEVGGPRGSTIVPDDFDWVLLVGDETALPAIGRRVEALRPGVPVTTMVVVDGAAERQVFDTKAAWTPVWVDRAGGRDGTGGHDDAALLLRALAAHAPPSGDGYLWIAAEARVARAVRAHLAEVWRHPEEWTRASGYWVRGEPGAHA